MKRKQWLTAAVTVSLLSTTVLSACSKSDEGKESGPAPSSNPTAASGAAAYPLKTDATLSIWGEIDATILPLYSTRGDTPFYKELEKATGVKVKFTHPALNQAKEQLNIMFASGEPTDIIEFNFKDLYPGGPTKAIKDGNILKLNDLFAKYAPNLTAYLKEHPEVDRQIKTDDGSYYGFPFIRGDDFLTVYQGPIIRKDWLDELALPIPETMDEWYTTLKAFKEKKGIEAPLTFQSQPRLLEHLYNGAFIGAFGVNRSFYQEDGKVKFGPAEAGYKEFLATFRKWYAEGLIDKNIATIDSKLQTAQITSGKSGATIGNVGGGIGQWLPVLKGKDAKAQLVGAPYPVLKKGDTPKFGQKDFVASSGGFFAISPQSKNAELAVKYLDFGYSKEGALFYNFGKEGVGYNLDSAGYPKYSDLIINNPDKHPMVTALMLYTRAPMSPSIQDKRYGEQYFAMAEQRSAIDAWKKTDKDKYSLPPSTPNTEESSEFAKIMNEINTLVDETTAKIIMGNEPVEYFDKYLEKLKSLKIDRAIEIQQAAMERYNKR
jgi:putative aldouronate transport system substrate-binding protein